MIVFGILAIRETDEAIHLRLQSIQKLFLAMEDKDNDAHIDTLRSLACSIMVKDISLTEDDDVNRAGDDEVEEMDSKQSAFPRVDWFRDMKGADVAMRNRGVEEEGYDGTADYTSRLYSLMMGVIFAVALVYLLFILLRWRKTAGYRKLMAKNIIPQQQ